MNDLLLISRPVQEALRSKQPVLALESTVITHGMPYPSNMETALELEEEAIQLGVTPATICVINGQIRIGVTKEELYTLAKATDSVKLSIRDIPYALHHKQNGGTTVAATMFLAQKAGIQVFSTGGIGGVHRLAEETFDISADLPALASIPMIVVCAGAKLILDIPKTLEYLETHSVSVLGYQTPYFPAFYSRETPFAIDIVEKAQQIAEMKQLQDRLHYQTSILIANPIPHEFEIPYQDIAGVIQNALQKAKEENIRGKATTPYLLNKLYELTEGKSLAANIQLIKNNVRVGSLIAIEVAKLALM